VAALGIEAADQAIAMAKWNTHDAAVICCTSKGPVESWLACEPKPVLRYAQEPDIQRQRISGSSAQLRDRLGEDASFGLSDFSRIIAHHTALTTGPRLTFSAACASGLHGLICAAMMIQSGEISRALVVAAEASVHPLFLASFRRLGVLVPEGDLCRPFDIHRHGFLMSDAAAAVCIEAVDEKGDITNFRRRRKRGDENGVMTDFRPEISDDPFFVAIDRFALGGDATHLTGSDPQARVLRHLLKHAIADQPMDLIHAHGTGTISNDSTELAAIESVLPAGSSPHLFSHKGALGHSLGASGLVSVVLNCLMHRKGLIPPNINTMNAIPASTVSISRHVERRQITHSLIHAAGFGGPMAVVTLRSVQK
jgi:3-oxoacyl-[acyl-carrier-protein] synthase II